MALVTLVGTVTFHWLPLTPKLDWLAMVAGMEPVMVVGNVAVPTPGMDVQVMLKSGVSAPAGPGPSTPEGGPRTAPP